MKAQKHFQNNWKNYAIAILLILFVGNSMLSGLVSPMSSNMISKSLGYTTESIGYDRGMMYYDEGFAPDVEKRKVIKNANLELETDDYDKSKAQIQNSINSYDILILSETETRNINDDRQLSYTLKVEADKLDIFLAEVKTYGEIESLNVFTNDVTGSYSDYTARVDRYNSQITKYISMLSRNNISIAEEIQIQNRIDSLEDQIFYLNKRIATIDEEVAYSDVRMYIKEKPSVLSEVDFLGLKDGFKLFMNSLENGIQFILSILGFIMPFAIIYGLYIGVRRFKK